MSTIDSPTRTACSIRAMSVSSSGSSAVASAARKNEYAAAMFPTGAEPAERKHEIAVARTVGLRRQQAQLVRAIPELVDEELAVNPVCCGVVAEGTHVIPDRGQQQHQGREPLLSVDDQPVLHTSRLKRRTRCDDHRADEVSSDPRIVNHLALSENIAPQPAPVRFSPAIRALIQRNLELLLTLHQIQERHLMGSHALTSLWPAYERRLRRR